MTRLRSALVTAGFAQTAQRESYGQSTSQRFVTSRTGVLAVELRDLRCTSVLITAEVKGRCQLRVGHEGAHATVIGHDDHTQNLYSWSRAGEFLAMPGDYVTAPYHQRTAAGLAWAPGMPSAQPRRFWLPRRR